MRASPLLTAVAALAALSLVATACGDDGGESSVEAGRSLTGLLRLEPGECDDAGVTTGSSFRMVTSDEDATIDGGPYVENPDSPCSDTTWTPLAPGEAGGLRIGDHQPNPDPVFDEAGNSLAAAIVQPQTFFALDFGLATDPTDPQTETEVAGPTLRVHDDGTLSGDLSAFAASWNDQHFNQGSPKPDGTTPGLTRPVSGTYDADTGAMTLEWSSLIVGGPFDQFTGLWHLQGTFEPA